MVRRERSGSDPGKLRRLAWTTLRGLVLYAHSRTRYLWRSHFPFCCCAFFVYHLVSCFTAGCVCLQMQVSVIFEFKFYWLETYLIILRNKNIICDHIRNTIVLRMVNFFISYKPDTVIFSIRSAIGNVLVFKYN